MAEPSHDQARPGAAKAAREPQAASSTPPAQAARPALQTLDLGAGDLAALVCDINDPDCIAGLTPGVLAAPTGAEDDP